MSACCGVSRPRLGVSECLNEGLATRRLAPLPLAGASISGPDGLEAAFSLALNGDSIADVRFRCSSCATLIACCQALVTLVRGRSFTEAAALDAEALRIRLPGIPPARANRAVLALAALRMALRLVPETDNREHPR